MLGVGCLLGSGAACLWESSRFRIWGFDPAGHSVLMKPQGALAFWRPLPSPPAMPSGKLLLAFILEVLLRRQESPRLLPATRKAAGNCSLCACGSGEAELPGGGRNWLPTLAEKSSWASLPAFSPPPHLKAAKEKRAVLAPAFALASAFVRGLCKRRLARSRVQGRGRRGELSGLPSQASAAWD